MISNVKRYLIVLKLNRMWVEGDDVFKIGTWAIRLICMVIMFVSSLGIIIKMYIHKDDLETITYCMSLIGATGPSFGKFYCLIKHYSVFKRILKKLETELASKYDVDEKEKKHIEHAEKMVIDFVGMYLKTTVVGCTSLVLMPCYKKIVMLLNFVPEGPVGTQVPTWTPFSMNDDFNYYLMCIVQGYHWYSAWGLWVGTDILFGGIEFHLCGHLNIVSDRLTDWILSRSNKSDSSGSKGKKLDLANIVSYHLEILEYVSD